jgi:hypothetical protein
MRSHAPQEKSMSGKFTRLSRSAEDYLEAIGHLCRETGRAQVSDVATMLHVKNVARVTPNRFIGKTAFDFFDKRQQRLLVLRF